MNVGDSYWEIEIEFSDCDVVLFSIRQSPEFEAICFDHAVHSTDPYIGAVKLYSNLFVQMTVVFGNICLWSLYRLLSVLCCTKITIILFNAFETLKHYKCKRFTKCITYILKGRTAAFLEMIYGWSVLYALQNIHQIFFSFCLLLRFLNMFGVQSQLCNVVSDKNWITFKWVHADG